MAPRNSKLTENMGIIADPVVAFSGSGKPGLIFRTVDRLDPRVALAERLVPSGRVREEVIRKPGTVRDCRI